VGGIKWVRAPIEGRTTVLRGWIGRCGLFLRGRGRRNERQYDAGDGDGDPCAWIASRTGDSRRATAVQDGHQTGTGHTEHGQRHEGAGSRPDHAVCRTKHRVTEQPTWLYHLTSPRWAATYDKSRPRSIMCAGKRITNSNRRYRRYPCARHQIIGSLLKLCFLFFLDIAPMGSPQVPNSDTTPVALNHNFSRSGVHAWVNLALHGHQSSAGTAACL